MANVKISDLTNILTSQAETGLEFEIEQEGISYKISLATVIEILNTIFQTQSGMSAFMPKTGGTFTGGVAALDENPLSASKIRNMQATATDPGAGSNLATGKIILVYEDA